MPVTPHIIFTVTNDLSYDQRMQRICRTLAAHGYKVTLIGRQLPNSLRLEQEIFQQKRIRCFFNKGFAFYAEYNLRLLGHLLFASYDAVCSIDTDTLGAGCLATLVRRKQRVFDAHEYFTEVPELQGRAFVRKCWSMLERICLPFYKYAYTVGPGLADIFSKKYGIPFQVVRNVPAMKKKPALRSNKQPYILLYQGALNEGKGIETAIAALKHLPELELWLAGEGDLSAQLRELAATSGAADRVQFLGYVKPKDLAEYTEQAWMGINLLENKGLSYYYSLANKYFDYVQSCVPVLTMDFPEYRALQKEFPVAVLLPELSEDALVTYLRNVLNDDTIYESFRKNCLMARDIWNWENEQRTLLQIWADALKKTG